MKQAGNKSLANAINEEEELTFRQYVYTPQRTSQLGVFHEHNQEIGLSHRDIMAPLALQIAAVVALALLSSKTNFGKGMALYNPQSVIGQLDYKPGALGPWVILQFLWSQWKT